MEKRTFKYGKHKYVYLLECSNRKTFSLVVTPNLHIILKVPEKTSDEEIRQFLIKKWVWLNKQIKELTRYKKTKIKKSFVSGESFYYLGRQYMLKVKKSDNEGVKISPGVMLLIIKKQCSYEHKKMIYDRWYMNKCEEVFKEELIDTLREYGIKDIPRLKIREMKSRWGSYQKNSVINLNPKLLQASRMAIRYVITHELCHIEYKNHDAHFYALLQSRVPEWEHIKDSLEMRFG